LQSAQILIAIVNEARNEFGTAGPIGTGTFKLDPSAMPKTIDSSPAADPSKPILGIYEFEGETLKICNAQPGKSRPSDFEAKAGSGHTLIVWQREK
jgi:uncharacterized protein (TIGR03067 family)